MSESEERDGERVFWETASQLGGFTDWNERVKPLGGSYAALVGYSPTWADVYEEMTGRVAPPRRAPAHDVGVFQMGPSMGVRNVGDE